MTPKPGVLGFAKRPVGTFYHHQPCQRHDAMMFLMLVYNDPDAGNASDVGDVATAVSRDLLTAVATSPTSLALPAYQSAYCSSTGWDFDWDFDWG